MSPAASAAHGGRSRRVRFEVDAPAVFDAIAKDSKRLMTAMALDFKTEIDGLNRRVEWKRASAAELLLYIRYSVTISDCRQSQQ
jgi:hypothetical protein